MVFTIKDGIELLRSVPLFRKILLSKQERENLRSYLTGFHYYENLSPEKQELFFKRTLNFCFSKNFVGMKGLEITDEIRMLISASAVQLTFGLKHYRLTLLEDILVYPSTFFSPRKDKEFKGAFFTSGKMMLSWEDFVHGYKIRDDKFNLGLHEMTHAMRLALYSNYKFDTDFASYIDTWEEISASEFLSMRKGAESVLRSYGKTNRDEFFSVCVEHFFEAPDDLKKNLPEVYFHLCVLLNQAPCNRDNDYQLDAEFYVEAEQRKLTQSLPVKIKRHYKYHSWHWSLTVLMLGVAGFIFQRVFFSRITVLDFENYLIGPLVIGTIVLSQWRRFEKKQALDFMQFTAFCYIGVGVTVVTLGLLLNYFTCFFSPSIETYKMVDSEKNYRRTRTGRHVQSYTVRLDHDAYYEYPGIRTFYAYEAPNGKYLRYHFAHGIFGIKMVKDRVTY